MKRKIFLTFTLIFLFLILTQTKFNLTSAHNFGSFWEKEVNGYKVDVGYSPELVVEDLPIRFDFAVLDPQTNQELNYTDLWVRIEKDNTLFFAGGIVKSKFGPTGISYNFSEPNDYTLVVRYNNASGTMVETDFSFTVAPKKISFWLMLIPRYWTIVFIVLTVTTLLLIYFIFSIFYKRIRNRNNIPFNEKQIDSSESSQKTQKLSSLLNVIIIALLLVVFYLLIGIVLDLFELNFFGIFRI